MGALWAVMHQAKYRPHVLTFPGSVTGLQLADLTKPWWGRTFIHMMCCISCKQWDLFFDDGLPDKTPTNGMLAVDRTDTGTILG